jgi:hypothetical protein
MSRSVRERDISFRDLFNILFFPLFLLFLLLNNEEEEGGGWRRNREKGMSEGRERGDR